MSEMVSETPPIPMEGGFLCFNDQGVAACTRCGWRGVANYEGNVVVSRPRYVHNPHDDEVVQVPGKLVIGRRSSVCPVCEGEEYEEPERKFRGTARNAPCPCGSGVKYKKCHGG